METVLQIYQALTKQWSGRILIDGEEIGRVAGCASSSDVEEIARRQGVVIDRVEEIKEISTP